MVTGVLGFVDTLISFWGQKVKGEGHSRRRYKRGRKTEAVEFCLVSNVINVHVADGLYTDSSNVSMFECL